MHTSNANNEICRLCLKIIENTIPIFSKDSKICDAIMRCTLVQVSEHDEYPQVICPECDKRLQDAFEFKLMCEKSDEILRTKKATNESLLSLIKEEQSAFDAEIYSKSEPEDICYDDNDDEQLNDSVRSDNVQYKRKVRSRSGKGSYKKKTKHKCGYCGVETKTTEDLNKHKLTHLPPYICRFCKKEFSSINFLINHEKTHASDDPELQCKICNKKFVTRARLSVHMDIHTGANIVECDICFKKISNKNLKRHMLIHSGDKPYPCTICDSAFTRSAFLMVHMDKHRDPNDPHKCPLCNYTTPKINSLWKHKALCNPLSKKLKHGSPGNGTKKTSTQKLQQFLCNYCGKVFSTKTGLSVHELMHTDEKPHICKICNKGFRLKIALIRHERIHSGEKPYQCKVCQKSFNQDTHLRKHMVLHTGIKKFSCNLCNKAFAHKDALQYHTMTHTGEKPYLCSICNKGFYIRYRLKVHLSKTHSISIETAQINKKK